MDKITKILGKIVFGALVFCSTSHIMSMNNGGSGNNDLSAKDLKNFQKLLMLQNGGSDLFALQQAGSFSERIQLSAYKGVHDALSGAIRETAGKMFQIFPSTLDALKSSFSNLYHRFFTQLKPLDWDILIIINNRLTKLITPYTQVSLGNFSKEKRAELDTNIGSNNPWMPVKYRILGELDFTINFFKKSLIWYSPEVARASRSGIVRRVALKVSNSFSGWDQESIKNQIGYTISDLVQLREIIAQAQSLKEMQEKHAELKTWLSIVCQDLKYIAQLINYGSESGTAKQENKFMEPAMSSGSSGSSSKSSGMSLNDIDLSSLAGL